MSLVAMKKISLLVHTSVAADVLKVVQNEGVVEFVEKENTLLDRHEPTEFEFNYVSARLDFAVEFLSDYAPQRSGLAIALEGEQERVTEMRISETIGNVYTTEVVDRAQDIQKEMNDTHKKIRALKEEHALLAPWTNADFTVGQNYNTETTETLFVVYDAKNVKKDKKAVAHAALTKALAEQDISSYLVVVDDTRAVLTIAAQQRTKLDSLLTEYLYSVVAMEQRRGTPAQEIDRIERSLVKMEEKIVVLEDKARALSLKYLADIKIASDYTLWQKERHDALVQASRTKDVLVYEGWCVATHVERLDQKIADVTDQYVFSAVTPLADDVPPVEIKNNALVKPFEAVTRLYGLPGARDIDPTPYLAGFFFVFFGFCLTDVGYGAILATVTCFLLWRYDVQDGTKIMLKLLFLGGVASFVAGLFFGGYFGLDMSRMPGFLQSIQVFDPIKDPLPVFYFALFLGLIQVMFGLVVGIISKAKDGRLTDGLLDHVPWLFFFVAMGLFVADMMGAVAVPGATYITWLAVASLIVTQGHQEKKLVMKAFKGVASLYDVVSYFSDILSYSRLLALGLATSALAFAVNLIAAMVAGEDPTLFSLVMASIILVIGHLFNLVVNTLGAFIHSARLQFVEFFGKFLDGTGRPFQPFTRMKRHLKIVE